MPRITRRPDIEEPEEPRGVQEAKIVPAKIKPTLGRIVFYRTDARNGLSYDLPAIITCTKETHPGDYPNGDKNPVPVPSSPDHVHLTVFSAGNSGTYVEDNVPFYDPADSGQPIARSWRWPNIRS